jgi:hypothetical protein
MGDDRRELESMLLWMVLLVCAANLVAKGSYTHIHATRYSLCEHGPHLISLPPVRLSEPVLTCLCACLANCAAMNRGFIFLYSDTLAR